jgi:hypothetical protein
MANGKDFKSVWRNTETENYEGGKKVLNQCGLSISSVEVCQQLVKCKRQVESELNQEAQKRHKLENDLATLNGEMSTLQKVHKHDKGFKQIEAWTPREHSSWFVQAVAILQ